MCGHCGILGDGSHWADGLADGPGESPASAVPWLRRQARRQRVAAGNIVLRHYGLSLAAWQGPGFLLRSRTGATQIVTSLGDLWPKAERMAGIPPDPLDPSLLQALERHAAE
jgi:hypothetical protein